MESLPKEVKSERSDRGILNVHLSRTSRNEDEVLVLDSFAFVSAIELRELNVTTVSNWHFPIALKKMKPNGLTARYILYLELLTHQFLI